MPALSYEGGIYHFTGDGWRGPDGHTVHLLTWVSDDIQRRSPEPREVRPRDHDLWVTRQVVERLGDRARLLDDGD